MINATTRTFVNREWSQFVGTPDTINHSATTIDADGNLIVVGNTLVSTNNTDVIISKYDPDGNLIWQQLFNGTANQKDYGVQVVTDPSKSVYVVAAVTNTTTSFDIALIKYNSSGVLQWSTSYNGTAGLFDIPSCITIDNSNNIYIGGGVMNATLHTDFITLKYNSSGQLQWANTYDYASLYDYVTGIEIGSNSDVIVTGASASGTNTWDYTTISYSLSGSQQTVERTNVPGVGLDQPLAIAKDNSGNIYITGYREINGDKDIQTLKFNSSLVLQWAKNFDGDGSGSEDVGRSIGIDGFGNCYVTGYSYRSNGGSDFITIKYDASGNELWNIRYAPPIDTWTGKASKIYVTPSGERHSRYSRWEWRY